MSVTAIRGTDLLLDGAKPRRMAPQDARRLVVFGSGPLAPGELVRLAKIVTGARDPGHGRPRLFKSAGMGWEDLAVGVRVFLRHGGGYGGGRHG